MYLRMLRISLPGGSKPIIPECGGVSSVCADAAVAERGRELRTFPPVRQKRGTAFLRLKSRQKTDNFG